MLIRPLWRQLLDVGTGLSEGIFNIKWGLYKRFRIRKNNGIGIGIMAVYESFDQCEAKRMYLQTNKCTRKNVKPYCRQALLGS